MNIDVKELEVMEDIASLAVVTGEKKEKYLLWQLEISMAHAKRIDLIVSFLMESGLKMLLPQLKQAQKRGVPIRILTGNYLGITQPSALYLLRSELGDQIDLRFYADSHRSFHPKAYFFHADKESRVFIGSSNISRSALTSGIEWNYCLSSVVDKQAFDQFYASFEDLFYNKSVEITDTVLKKYAKSWVRPAVAKDLARYEKQSEEEKQSGLKQEYQPRGVQIEALYELEKSRKEGAEKGIVHAATGIGKTYLAVFDSLPYKRVLFVAHREEILNQAATTFRNIRNSDDYGFFRGADKCTDKSVIFASVMTLGKSEYLNDDYFARDYFDYIVIDEFHHAVNNPYRKIVDYFQPKFLLGLTATPERMDGRNIYEICDYNVPYELPLADAINKGMLVPFHYYGIYDDTDYSKLHVVKGRYDSAELNATYIGNVHRQDLIYKYYCKYGSKRALGFCCTREHAEEMAKEFCKRGIPSVAVYSDAHGQFSEDRNVAIEKLKSGEIRVIFSVDMFNEGVDVPSVDMVMFLRPTESPTVFLQQLGRGLRKSKGKEFLNVLDFIGNYLKAGRVRYLLTGKNLSGDGAYDSADRSGYPDDCMIDFDMRLIDLFAEMDKKHLRIKDQIRNEYFRVKELLDKRPTRMELFTYMDDDVYRLAISHAADNPFKRYLDFLKNLDELMQEEESLYGGIGWEFINLIENTNMSKVYKMPVLMAFYNHGNVRMEVSEAELLDSWKEFFNTSTNWKDLDKGITYQDYLAISDKEHVKKIMQMPVHFLLKSGNGFFVEKDGAALALSENLREVVGDPMFAEHMRDAIEYRAMDYYQRRYQEKNDA